MTDDQIAAEIDRHVAKARAETMKTVDARLAETKEGLSVEGFTPTEIARLLDDNRRECVAEFERQVPAFRAFLRTYLTDEDLVYEVAPAGQAVH